MAAVTAKDVAMIVIGAAIALTPASAQAQSSGGSSGGSSGDSAGGAAGSSGGSAGGSSSSGSGAAGSSMGGSSGSARSGAATTSPSRLGTQAPSTATPGLTTPAQERAGQRAGQVRDTTPSTTAPPEGDDRGRTSDVGREAETVPGSPGLPARSDPNRRQPNELSSGGGSRQGAVGKTMAECEGAWDSETHMSRENWRETCRRTLTEPHL